jgi:hypothetical protein
MPRQAASAWRRSGLRCLGAEVIGTAGPSEKREIVLAEGAARVFDSRSASSLHDARVAFRTTAAGRHVGKLVLVPPRAANLQVRGDGTYLVTGGLGGIGLATAESTKGVRSPSARMHRCDWAQGKILL